MSPPIATRSLRHVALRVGNLLRAKACNLIQVLFEPSISPLSLR